MATLNGSSRVLKVIDIIDKGPNAEQPALGTALWPCISTALEAWWLTSISLVDRNEACGPRAGNLVGTVPRKRTFTSILGNSMSLPTAVGGWGGGEGEGGGGGGGGGGCYVAVTTVSTQLLPAQLLCSPSSVHSVMEAPWTPGDSADVCPWATWAGLAGGRGEVGSPCSWSSSHHLIGLTYWVLTFQ